MPRLTLSKALYWIVLQWRCWTKVDMSVKWYRGHLIPNDKELAGFVSQCRNERYNYRGCPICLKGQIHYRHSNILLHFYCLDVSWMNKAKDIQQLKIIWICFNIFSSDNICERSTVSSVDYNIIVNILTQKGYTLYILWILSWIKTGWKEISPGFKKRRGWTTRESTAISPIFKQCQSIKGTAPVWGRSLPWHHLAEARTTTGSTNFSSCGKIKVIIYRWTRKA